MAAGSHAQAEPLSFGNGAPVVLVWARGAPLATVCSSMVLSLTRRLLGSVLGGFFFKDLALVPVDAEDLPAASNSDRSCWNSCSTLA